ncbi:fimbrial biogenesis chaperone [Stenotrophomonas maltophilia]|uniref:fimbrial biogenesis chaperone n=1 Tax=Stenotrophomonas maltophilia TaxID=40324 RepID=UPI000DA98080|nr:fimbria/pilus periplasmic chaperone [Stenotrophomonas maltophilia]
MRTLLKKTLCVSMVAMTTAAVLPAQARIAVETTRVVYAESEKEVSVRVANAGVSPSLVQAWVGEYGVASTPSTSQAPFVLLPPVVRVDAGKQQVLRIRFTGAKLPEDRESVYWLNVLEVPARNEASGTSASTLNIAVRNRVKLFYRPQSLVKLQPTEAPKRLRWELVRENGTASLKVHNDSPFHVSTVAASLVVNGKDVQARDVTMVSPMSSRSFPLPEYRAMPGSEVVRFKYVSEHGSVIEASAALQSN